MALKSGFTLNQGEELVMELEAELWATSTNPIAKAIGEFWKFIARILGFKMHCFLILTNNRVIEVREQTACYVFKTGRSVKFVLPSSVKEIGYIRKTTCMMFCPMYCLYYEGHTQSTLIQMKDADEAAALKAANAFYAAIASANVGAAA